MAVLQIDGKPLKINSFCFKPKTAPREIASILTPRLESAHIRDEATVILRGETPVGLVLPPVYANTDKAIGRVATHFIKGDKTYDSFISALKIGAKALDKIKRCTTIERVSGVMRCLGVFVPMSQIPKLQEADLLPQHIPELEAAQIADVSFAAITDALSAHDDIDVEVLTGDVTICHGGNSFILLPPDHETEGPVDRIEGKVLLKTPASALDTCVSVFSKPETHVVHKGKVIAVLKIIESEGAPTLEPVENDAGLCTAFTAPATAPTPAQQPPTDAARQIEPEESAASPVEEMPEAADPPSREDDSEPPLVPDAEEAPIDAEKEAAQASEPVADSAVMAAHAELHLHTVYTPISGLKSVDQRIDLLEKLEEDYTGLDICIAGEPVGVLVSASTSENMKAHYGTVHLPDIEDVPFFARFNKQNTGLASAGAPMALSFFREDGPPVFIPESIIEVLQENGLSIISDQEDAPAADPAPLLAAQ